MNIFREAFDFFFPLMPSAEREDSKVIIKAETINGDVNTLQKKAQAAKRYYDEEKERLKTIEGKASMFITSSGFLGTVLIGTSNILIGQKDADMWFKVLMVICLFFFVCYMVCTVIISVKALERSKYNRPDPTTLIEINKGVDYDKQYIADLLNSTIHNQDTANRKMDNVVVAQRYFKRLMISVLAFVIVLLVYVLEKNGLSLLSWFGAFKEEVLTWNLNLWFVFISSILILSSFTLGIVALVTTEKLKKNQ